MSDRPFRATWIPWALALIFIGSAWAQEVSFVSPQNGATVRGVVNLQATKPSPNDGWVSYKIGPAGKEAQYLAAIIRPFAFAWDTRGRGKDGAKAFPDGDYVVTATAFDPSGNQVGETSVTVAVANEIKPLDLGGPVELRCSYTKAEKLTFKAEGRLNITLPQKEKERLYIPLNMDVLVKAEWEEVVLSPTSGDSPAVVDKVISTAFVQVTGSEGNNLPGAGKRFRLKVWPNGFIDVYKEKDDHFPLGEYFVKLPARKVSQGDTWQADLAVLPLPVAVSRRVLQTRMTLDGFEYVVGQRCARIATSFKDSKRSVRVRLGSNVFPLETSYEADRVSFFGLDGGHFVAFEERMKHTLELPVQVVQLLYQFQLGPQAQSAMSPYGMAGGSGMMGGMPGMPGMGPMGPDASMMGGAPSGMPGMAMPGMAGGMQPYGGAMYGADMSGMAMGGMGGIMGDMGEGMGGAQMKPAEVLLESQLRITETTPVKS